MRALPASGGGGNFNFTNFTNVAIFRYAGAPIANPPGDPSVNVPVIQQPLVETNLHVSGTFSLYLFIDEVNFFSLSSHLLPLPW
jgi:hypothetical protein